MALEVPQALGAVRRGVGLETESRDDGVERLAHRRVIVDEAFDRSRKLACKLLEAENNNEGGILGEVARALRSVNEEQNRSKAPPLDRAQLRGTRIVVGRRGARLVR